MNNRGMRSNLFRLLMSIDGPSFELCSRNFLEIIRPMCSKIYQAKWKTVPQDSRAP